MEVDFPAEINEKLREYYFKYYSKDLGLPDYQARIEKRLKEELSIKEQINKFCFLSNIQKGEGKKVLVVGAGSGAELVIFKEMGFEAYGIEPNSEAVEIAKNKLEHLGLDPSIIRKETLEELNFEENYFDYIYCWTVIEHVQDLQKSIDNMVKVCKSGGTIFIETPDYRFCYEPHYKMILPMFFPRFLIKALLFSRGRPTSFIDSLQFVTSKKLRRIFKRQPVTSMQVSWAYPQDFFSNKSIMSRLAIFFSDKLEIERDQFWVLRKNS